MSIILYQFPISHYCEKVRWALDYKGLLYQVKNLLPGLHWQTTKRIAPRSSVPILQLDGEIIQGSAQIITALDQRYPQRSLTPTDPALREAALQWEAMVDKEIGVHVRRFAYHTLLNQPKVVQSFFLQDGKWWWQPILKLMFPRLSSLMRQAMKIDEAGAEQSRQQLESALAKVCSQLSDRDFLVGNQFSRADLAAAALIAPMIMAPKYGLNWPEVMPEPLQTWADTHTNELVWARQFYQTYR